MVRWKYLLPRLGILLIVIMVINLMSNPLLRWAVVHSGQAMTGARLDIGSVKASLWAGRIILTDVQVADPRDPMKNLIQANTAELNLNADALIHGKLIVQQARLGDVQFGTPRTESGALPGVDSDVGGFRPAVPVTVEKPAETRSNAWIDELLGQIPGLIEGNLETVQVARQLNSRWPQEFRQRRRTATELKNRAVDLRQSIEKGSDNPLRNMSSYQSTMASVRQLYVDVEKAKQELHVLGKQFMTDKQQLIAAKNRDQEKIKKNPQTVSINAQRMTELLLENRTADALQEVVNWAQWFRNALPDPKKDFQPTRRRGVDVPFQRHPKVIFQQIQLDGEGLVAGQKLNFAGVAKNISTEPHLLDQPATFEMRGQGQIHVLVTATVDRRGPQRIDSVKIFCPRLSLPAQVFGPNDSLRIGVQPSNMSFQLEARLVDNQLTGQGQFHHSNVQMRLESIDDLVGDREFVQSINSQLGQIDRFDVSVQFDGPLDRPTMQLSSDLGAKFAQLMTAAFQEKIRGVAISNLSRLQTILEAEIREFDNMFTANLSEIMNVLDHEIPTVSRLPQYKMGQGIR